MNGLLEMQIVGAELTLLPGHRDKIEEAGTPTSAGIEEALIRIQVAG